MRFLRQLYNRFSAEHQNFTRHLSELLGFVPTNLSIFKLAFKHTSRSSEAYTSNERLEYLGDSVLGTIVAEYLFKKYPFKGEGFLTEMRSKMVNRKQLGEVGEKLLLKDFLDYDKAYVNINSTLLGNALEALVGAVYLDVGYDRTKAFVFDKIIYPHMDIDDLESNDINFKSRLFEWAQKYEKDLQFNIIEEKISDKSRLFTVGAYIDGKIEGKGDGRSKKDAQKNAAKEAYEKLNVAIDMAETK